MAKKKIKNLKDMTAEEILNGMKGVKVTNLKDGDVLVGDGKGNLVNKPKSDLNSGQWRIYIQDTIKLNEELTAENARLLTEFDKLRQENRDCNEFIELNNKTYEYANGKLISELEKIKSKWWYKLMTWGWKR